MAAKLGFEIVKQAMLKLLMKKGDDGIVLTLPKNEILDLNTRITMDRLIRNNIDPNSLTSPDQVINVLDNIDNANKPKVIPGTSAEGKAITEKLFGKKGEVIEFPQKRSFKEEIEAMKKSGDIVDVDDIKISEKITDREMFKNSNLNKKDSVTETISYIKTLKPMDAMKEANSVIGRKGKYKNLTPEESKKILTDTEDHIFERDIPDEDFAKGGRAEHYTGGIVDVEPSLSDIGHGSDALMARTRLVSPGNQATTSTGLNYLLAEDNDNLRVPFSKGKLADAARRKFMKTAGAGAAGIAALKTGLIGLGEKAAPVVEKAVEAAQGVPPYFFQLVDVIKSKGREIKSYGDRVKQYITPSKDGKSELMLTEDLNTGDIQVKKIYKEGDDMVTKTEEMNFNKGRGDEATKGTPADDYDEFTTYHSRIYKDEFNEPDFIPEIDVKEIVKEIDVKKADGGRIGYGKGKLVMEGGRKFLEKVFGKERFATMVENDPRMQQGMLEVVDMFRNKDKEGLKMYLQKYLPHMDDAEIEDFIVGSDGTEGITGQLIRLGSGREYESLMDLKKQADNVRKLEDFNIDGVSKNAEGGRIGLFMGGGLKAGKGLLRTLLNFMAEKSTHGKKGSEMLQLVNPKQLDKYLDDPALMGKVSPEAPAGIPEIINAKKKELTEDRSNMVGDLIGTARRIKKVDDDIVNYKETIINDMIGRGIDRETAVEMAENLAEMVAKNAGKKTTPKITEQGLLEAENIQKNLITKDRRKLQAQGGLTTMLGE
jgi:hypothetical protein